METDKPFPLALCELVIENDYVTHTGKPSWAVFASELEGFHYDSLRRVAIGKRYPSARIIEECARCSAFGPSTSSSTGSTSPSATLTLASSASSERAITPPFGQQPKRRHALATDQSSSPPVDQQKNYANSGLFIVHGG